jgi:hypothetical protein
MNPLSEQITADLAADFQAKLSVLVVAAVRVAGAVGKITAAKEANFFGDLPFNPGLY